MASLSKPLWSNLKGNNNPLRAELQLKLFSTKITPQAQSNTEGKSIFILLDKDVAALVNGARDSQP